MYLLKRETISGIDTHYLEYHKDGQITYFNKQKEWQERLTRNCLFPYPDLHSLIHASKLYPTNEVVGQIEKNDEVSYFCKQYVSWGQKYFSEDRTFSGLLKFTTKEQALDFIKSLSKE